MGSQYDDSSGEPSSAFESRTFDKDVSIHVNEAIGAASISPSGRDVVLAS
jgi:WD repeat-containing protein 59